MRDLPGAPNWCHDFRVKIAAAQHGAGALVFALLIGCQASVNADAQVSGDEGAKGRAQAELSGSGEGKDDMRRASLSELSTRATAAMSAGDRVLLGARHDLKLESGKPAACQCLAVALGGVEEAGMAWSGGAPHIDETTQLSIALSSEGQTCQGEPKQSLGASYWGYRISGDNVVVLVEASRDGRPLTSGAIIPKPVGQGQVFVAPTSKKLPYGQPLEGSGLCKIGNPGRARDVPFTELEIGSDAPRPATGNVKRRTIGATPNRLDDAPTTLDFSPN